jgi:hypothetical protein
VSNTVFYTISSAAINTLFCSRRITVEPTTFLLCDIIIGVVIIESSYHFLVLYCGRVLIKDCNSDEVVTGGGVRVVDGINTVNPTHTFQGIHDSPNTFELTYTNIGGGEASIQVFAECAKLVQ